MAWGTGTILGGLPVWADVAFGKDADTPNGPGDYWSEVQEICWTNRDGTRGKPLPQHIVDRAEKADPYFAGLTEQVSDFLVHDAHTSAAEREGASGEEPAPASA